MAKHLLQVLRERGLVEYGQTFTGDFVRDILGLQMPEVASKQTFDRIALTELAAVDYCRNVLLGEGKYLGQDGGGYRILLPSENAAQVERYVRNADGKLKRALKLSRNSPPLDTGPFDSQAARIMMKREGLKDRYRWAPNPTEPDNS
jgi:hypothetical protein